MSLSNPKHVEYEVVRTSLLPGALKTAQFNRAMPVGQLVAKLLVNTGTCLPRVLSLSGFEISASRQLESRAKYERMNDRRRDRKLLSLR